jgi:hypothetical protein
MNTAIHVVFCLIIALLLAFIVRENAMDYDADIQALAQKTAQNGQTVIAISNIKLLRECIKIAKLYPSATSEKYLGFAKVVKLKCDSIQYLLDSLIQKTDLISITAIEKRWHHQQLLISEMTNLDKTVEATLLNFKTLDWLSLSLKDDTKEHHKMALERAKINNLLMETAALNYFASNITYDCGFGRILSPELNWYSIGSVIDDTAHADIHLSIYTKDDDRHRYIVNGIRLPDQKFRQRFNKAGTYPLHIKVEREDWAHDTIFVAEKTYFITVHK